MQPIFLKIKYSHIQQFLPSQHEIHLKAFPDLSFCTAVHRADIENKNKIVECGVSPIMIKPPVLHEEHLPQYKVISATTLVGLSLLRFYKGPRAPQKAR